MDDLDSLGGDWGTSVVWGKVVGSGSFDSLQIDGRFRISCMLYMLTHKTNLLYLVIAKVSKIN